MTEFNPLLHLRPVNFRVGEHEPQAWDPAGPDNQPASRLTVVLPGEIAVATVLKVVSKNAVIAQLGPVMCTGRGHSYRAKDIVPVRRENDEIGGERWAVVSDRELQQNEMIQQFEMLQAVKMASSGMSGMGASLSRAAARLTRVRGHPLFLNLRHEATQAQISPRQPEDHRSERAYQTTGQTALLRPEDGNLSCTQQFGGSRSYSRWCL